MSDEQSVGSVVGQQLRRLRGSQTQGEAAQHVRRAGLDWTRDHISSLESGRRETLTVEELLLLSSAYGVKLADWFEGEGAVNLSPDIAIDREDLRAALGRGRPMPRQTIDFTSVPEVDRTEASVAHRLSVEAPAVQQAAQQLWGRTFAQERDRRLGDVGDPSRARTLRAGMTKRLTREIEPTVRNLS